MGEIIGYARVSTKDQNLDRQIKALKEYGASRIFEEKISGKNTNRPELKAMMSFLRSGDTLVVESYSRLARSTVDLLKITTELQNKGIAFVSLKENVDSTTPQGRLVLTIFAGLSQFERECTLERQKEGIAIAREQGKYKGRKPIELPNDAYIIVSAWLSGEISATKAMQKLGMKRTTFYKYFGKRDLRTF